MRRRGSVAAGSLTCLVLATATSGCATPQRTQTRPDVLIGVNIELSGSAARLGQSYRNALELVVADINAKGVLGGRKVRLIIRDNRSDPDDALRVARDLWETHRVVAMVGPGVSPTSLAVVDAAERRQVPMVSMGSAAEIVNPVAERQYAFKTTPNNDDMAEIQVAQLIGRGVTRVAYLAPSDAFGDASVKAFGIEVDKTAIRLVATERYDANSDYAAEVRDVLRRRPDAIVVAAVPPQAAVLANEIQAAGFTGPVLFEAGAGLQPLFRKGDTVGPNILMVHPVILAIEQITATVPVVLAQKDFYRRYIQAHGSFAGSASYAADALGLIVAAIEKSGSVDPGDIRDALERTSYAGLTGEFTFSSTYHGGVDKASLAVLTARDGDWVPVF
ncbi:MAG TPA: ABC transporter substrate-binding protein [Cryptosporangiaceae bacterium]|nr:ABC transporter substrate-binding protein [Cryptosporangiaceae bacterium]